MVFYFYQVILNLSAPAEQRVLGLLDDIFGIPNSNAFRKVQTGEQHRVEAANIEREGTAKRTVSQSFITKCLVISSNKTLFSLDRSTVRIGLDAHIS